MSKRNFLIIWFTFMLVASFVVNNEVYSQNSNSNGKIAFASNRDGDYEIYLIDSDGTGLTQLTNNDYDDTQPSWSNDGLRLALVSNRDSGSYQSEIYVMQSDGTNQTRLTFENASTSWHK